MRLEFRDIRVTACECGRLAVLCRSAAPGRWLRPASIGARTARLVEAIAARYMTHSGWVSQEGMVYPSGRRPVALALRLALTLLHWPGMPGVHQDLKSRAGTRRSQENLHRPGTAGILGQSAFVMPAFLPQLLLRPAGFRVPAIDDRTAAGAGIQLHAPDPEVVLPAQARARPALAGALPAMRRLARRGERVPMVGEGRPGTALPAGAGPTVPPVQRTVRQSQPDTSEWQQGARIVPGSRMPGIDALPASWSALPGAVELGGLDPAQVGRFADRVVQVIDDRIVARRERMGRV